LLALLEECEPDAGDWSCGAQRNTTSLPPEPPLDALRTPS